MGVTTRDKAARPLGVIGCVAAGFEILGRNLWLIAFPALLDLFLWLGPQLSVAPLVQRALVFFGTYSVYDPETTQQFIQMMEQLGEQLNLFSLLSALPLFNVPSLLAGRTAEVASPLGEPEPLVVASSLALIAWVGLLVLVGLALGVLYLNSLARRVGAARLAEGKGTTASGPVSGPPQAETEEGSRARNGAGGPVRAFLFALGLLAIGMVLLPPWAMLIGMTAAIAQGLSQALAIMQLLPNVVLFLSIGLASYVVLHMLFVVHGLLLGGRGLWRAIWESAALIHMHLPYVVVLIVLVVVVYEGLGYVWSLPPGDSWLFLVGILGNGCVATGLIAATFVFYQERVGLLPVVRRVVEENGSGNGKDEGTS